ncbi:fungal-specific transcription factor domain-containing protein [Xylaria arbuscula]|nr:fungal-specific transcription factor domain-containing protein [Xylaria arbuscula]
MPCVVVDSSAAVPPALQSATSSDTTWDTTYQDDGPVGSANGDMNWEHGTDDVLTVAKIEPLEDDCFRMDDVQEAPSAPAFKSDSPSPAEPKAKRPRGRPRKHPPVTQQPHSKIAKGRSKTGCITCRRRKKKCDEAKPRCLNCEKNAVVCEGYHEKTLWKSPQQKKEILRKNSLPRITLQPIFEGVETPEDRIFFSHYINHLSGVLTVEGQHRNAFKDMLLPMALEHRGLMHSILSLSSSHIDFGTPYGSKLLDSNPKVDRSSMIARSEYHRKGAMHNLLQWGKRGEVAPDQRANLAPYYGQMLCLLLQTAADGTTNGAHRVHLRAYKTLIQENPPPDAAFTTFITELFQYRVFADELILYPDQFKRLATEDWEPWEVIKPPRLIGIGDRLFHFLAKITTLRNEIRSNLLAKAGTIVDGGMAFRAEQIYNGIGEWEPTWPAGDNRDRVSQLYKQMMWVYLYRTIFPPSTTPMPSYYTTSTIAETMHSTSGVDVDFNPYDATGNSVVDGGKMTPLSPASSQPCSDRRLSNRGLQATPLYLASKGSPPPGTQYPPHCNQRRLSRAVNDCLSLLEEFKPSDPVQTLLLVPCVVVGCAAFEPRQQERVRAAIRTVRGYTGLRNCDRLAEFLDKIWGLMSQAEWTRVWDWQFEAAPKKISDDLTIGFDFACA